jgi:hypothetical protein
MSLAASLLGSNRHRAKVFVRPRKTSRSSTTDHPAMHIAATRADGADDA